tara:strand:+ start:117 stop:638 length:522 start_codon:yes stop_codon:yes gene_type:complete
MIDISRVNLEEFFGCVNATNTKEMKSNTFKTFRTYLQEKSFAKWSDGQVKYVGDHMDGVDFLGEDQTHYEMKGTLKMFNKNGSTKTITLKNFQSENKTVDKTFEYMFLVDTENMTLGYTDWDTVEKRLYFTDKSPAAKVKFEKGDYTILASNVSPSKKSITASDILDGLERIL